MPGLTLRFNDVSNSYQIINPEGEFVEVDRETVQKICNNEMSLQEVYEKEKQEE